MARYEVFVHQVCEFTIEVEADSEEAAEEKARDIAYGGRHMDPAAEESQWTTFISDEVDVDDVTEVQ